MVGGDGGTGLEDWTAHAKGTCDGCGPFRVAATSVTVRQRLDDGTWSYRVRCPSCERWMLASMRPRVALQLLLARAPFEAWSLPDSARECGHGEPVSIYELPQLRADLARIDVVDVLRASLGVG